MTDDTTTDAIEHNTSKRKKPTPKFAYTVWRECGRPNFRELADILQSKGYSISFQRLHIWHRQDVKWFTEKQEIDNADPEVVIEALKQAQLDAKKFDAKAYLGVKARLVARLYESIKTMPLATMEEWHRGLDACSRIDGLLHTARGEAIQDGKPDPAAKLGGVLDRFAPAVAVKPFSKPAPTTTNGKAN